MRKKKKRKPLTPEQVLKAAWDDTRKALRDAHIARSFKLAVEAMKPPKKKR